MIVRFLQPGYLALLAMIPVFVYAAGKHRGGRWRDGIPPALWLRLAAMVLLILAVSGIQAAFGKRPGAVVFVVDRSASVAAPEKDRTLQLMGRAASFLRKQDEAGVVVFAKDALIEQPLKRGLAVADIQSTPAVTDTNIEQGLNQALAMLAARPESRRKIVLISDGNQTAGDAAKAAGAAAAQRTVVDVAPLRTFVETGGPRIRIEEVRGPEQVRLGEPFDLAVSLSGVPGSTVPVTVSRDGSPLPESTLTLSPEGEGGINLPDRLTSPGFHQYRIIAGGGKTPADEAGYVTYAYGKPRVLHLTEQAAGVLDEILQRQGFEVTTAAPGNAPVTPANLSPYDAIILDNVPAGSFSAEQMLAMAEHVEKSSAGMLMIGGAGSFGPGGYEGTPVEKVLPVEMSLKNREKKPAMAVVLVLDKSGSMGISEQKVSKLEMAKDAVMRLAELLTPEDALGIIAFDQASSELLPLEQGAGRARIQAAIRPLAPGGGTAILPAVRMAYQRLDRAAAERKHVLLMTDGQADRAERDRLVDMAAGGDVVLSAIGIGADVDREFLQQLAISAHGRTYFTRTGLDLPDIFRREAALIAGNWIMERAFRPREAVSHEMLRNLTGTLPELTGYIAATPKKTAEILWTTDNGDPLLVCRRSGLGKTLAFTTDLHSPWTRRLHEWQHFGRMWLQMVRWTSRGIPDGNLHARVVLGGKGPVLVIDAYDDSGRFIDLLDMKARAQAPDSKEEDVVMRQTAPGRYEGHFAAEIKGNYTFAVSARKGKTAEEQTLHYGFSLSKYPEERQSAADLPFLYRVAAETGGSVWNNETIESGMSSDEPAYMNLWMPAALLAMAAFLADVFFRRLRG